MSEVVKEALTKKLDFSKVKPVSAPAKSMRVFLQPFNKSEFSGQNVEVVQIRIPTGKAGQYLDTSQSYLQFTINNTSEREMALDGCAMSIINRFEVWANASSLQCEDIQEYGTFYNMLLDLKKDSTERGNGDNLLIGCDGGLVVDGTGTNPTAPTNPSIITGLSSPNRKGVTIEAGGSRTFCVPVVSGILALDQYLPIGAMRQGDMEIRMTLENVKKAFVYNESKIDEVAGTAGTHPDEPWRDGYVAPVEAIDEVPAGYGSYTLTNVRYVAQMVELDPSAEQNVRDLSGGLYRISSESFGSVSHTLESSTNPTSANVYLPFKHSSLKSIFAIHRPTENLSTPLNRGVTGRVKANLTQFQIDIGGQLFPQQPVIVDEHGVEVYMELRRALQSVSLVNGGGCINQVSWNQNECTTGDATFTIMQELESISESDNVLMSGSNVRNASIHFKSQYSRLENNMTLTFYSHYDINFYIDELGAVSIEA